MDIKKNNFNSKDKLGIFAVKEIKNYINKIFKKSSLSVMVNSDDTISEKYSIFLGTDVEFKENNFFIPVLDEQDFYLKRLENTLYIVGGSYEAVLWGVYELCEIWGMEFSLHGDIYPIEKKDFYLPEIDKIYKPLLKHRMWRLGSDLIPGPALWSREQNKKFILQIVKKKYNGIYFIMMPHFPYVEINIDGVKQKTFTYNYGCDVPIDESNIGKEFLEDTKIYTNPDFINCKTPEQWLETGKSFINEIFDYARLFNMKITVRVDALFNIMKDFSSVLEKPVNVKQVGDLYICEGGNIFGKKNIHYMGKVLEKYIDSFPQVERFCISAPEHPQSYQHFEKCWELLDEKYNLSEKFDIYDIVKEDKRKQNEAKMSISIIGLLHVFFEKTGLLEKLHLNGKKLAISPVLTCPEALPIINECLWPETDLILSLGYFSSDPEHYFKYIENIDFKGKNVELMLTLNDDNIGSYPQFTLKSTSINIKYLISKKFNGYYLRFFPIGELEPISDFIAKVSWDKNIVAELSLSNYITKVYGENAVEPLTRAFDLMEKATYLLEKFQRDISIFPVPKKISRNIRKDMKTDRCASKEVIIIKSLFMEAEYIFNCELIKCSKPEGRTHIKYYISRMNFAIKTISGILKLFDVRNSLGKDQIDNAQKHYEEACDYFRDALEGVKNNIRDDSDRGNLAVYYNMFLRETKKKMKELTIES